MKKQIILLLSIIAGAAMAYAQPKAPVPIKIKNAQQHSERFTPENIFKIFDKNAPIWKPKIYRHHHFRDGVMFDSMWHDFSYAQDGRLKELCSDDYLFGYTPVRKIWRYNLNYPEIPLQLLDSWTSYTKLGGVWWEQSRDYYEYSFSGEDIYESLIQQEWDGGEWVDTYKYVYEYLDANTLYPINQYRYKAAASDDWELMEWSGDSLFYDDQGNVSTMIRYETSTQEGYYEIPSIKMEYFREAGEKAYNAYRYYEYDKEAADWVLTETGFDIEWNPWYEFGHHENIQTAIKWQELRKDDTWKEYHYQYYALDDGISWGYSTFTQSDYWDAYIRAEYRDELYDEHGNRLLFVNGRARDYPSFLDSAIIVNTYVNYYDSEGRGLKKSEWRAISYDYRNPSDSLMDVNTAISEVLEFIDCTQVSILEPDLNQAATFDFYPNPARDQIQVFADEPMEQITLYDLTGRLLKEDFPRTQQTELQVGNLVPGVYLLKARLKSGAVKTEKVIVR